MTILLSLSLNLWSIFLSTSHNNFAGETIKDTFQFIAIVMQNIDTSVGSRAHVNELWTFLLEEYPKSAGIADNRGRLALEVAIENGLECIDELVGAEP
jgi:hypothetical protein